eukprot:6194120-Pleurochrysis_carterae.AAC.2
MLLAAGSSWRIAFLSTSRRVGEVDTNGRVGYVRAAHQYYVKDFEDWAELRSETLSHHWGMCIRGCLAARGPYLLKVISARWMRAQWDRG